MSINPHSKITHLHAYRLAGARDHAKMPGQKSSPRSIRLRTLFTAVIKGEKTIDDRNAGLFLEAVCDQDNKALCVQKIQASDHGRVAFQTALSSSTELPFLQESVTAVFRYLSAMELKTLCGGAVLQQLVTSFVEAELAWDAFTAAFKSGQLTGNGEEAFSFLLLELLSLPKEKATAFVQFAQDDTIKKRLLESRKQEVRLRAQRIAHVVENLSAGHSNRSTGPNGPGGRHDNDFAEFNKIAILPTADELSAKDPYLPRAHETSVLALRRDGLAFHLDAQFRLLREDMVHDMREEIQMVQNIQKGQRRAFSIEHLSLVGVHCDGRKPWSLQFQCMNDLPQLPKKSEASRRQFLEDNRKFLKHESLACIIADDEVITLGTLIREEDLIAMKPPVICLQIPEANFARALRGIKEAKAIKLVQLSTALFSYAPILKQLKEMKELPFENEILRWDPKSKPEPPAYQISSHIVSLVRSLIRNPFHDIQDELKLPSATKLDKSQATCFITGMLSRLGIIQGPPGESLWNSS